ncbi:hypothetical protein C8A03DRAFT_34349 [Achaetomium macrosporum]|uniref:Uncharacterized protein n=1 Tax=Achaetomium macrosporum TaxID=79813 RepID=A0AAN7C9X6_9PEZI|nr:hypothetical protein C8A03DRAFT_34349 [Achaetomium macrosporum]
MSGQEDGATGSPLWFPRGRQDLPGWRFDVITLLAVIGESSVAEHAQTLTASSLCLLPRIIPAPQALLRPSRPQRMPEYTATMAGVRSGVVLHTVGFFANIMHPLNELKPFAFKVLEIKHAELVDSRPVSASGGKGGKQGWWLWRRRKEAAAEIEMDGEARGNGTGNGAKHTDIARAVHFAESDPEAAVPAHASADGTEPPPPEQGTQPKRRGTMSEKLSDVVTSPTMVNSNERYSVPPNYYSPVHVLNVFSSFLTIGIIVGAGVWNDGTAIIAISLISIAGSVICYASWWHPIMMNRPATNRVPPGDVVIRTREGAFVLIKCTEEVARELYSGTEECKYVSNKFHRVFMGLGMVLLMVSVVLLGNCGWNSQVLIGVSYIVLNGLYWLMGLLPQRYFWDLNRYKVEDVTPSDAKRADEKAVPQDPREGTPSFTRTLWYAIRETRDGGWAERSGAMPATEQWKQWLKEAVDEAKKGNRVWQAVERKNIIMGSAVNEAAQHAPLQEVQQPRQRDTQAQGSTSF